MIVLRRLSVHDKKLKYLDLDFLRDARINSILQDLENNYLRRK